VAPVSVGLHVTREPVTDIQVGFVRAGFGLVSGGVRAGGDEREETDSDGSEAHGEGAECNERTGGGGLRMRACCFVDGNRSSH